MPTDRPRLTIQLTPKLAQSIKALAGLTGQSQSALVLEFLEGMQPAIEHTAELLQAVKRAKPEALEAMKAHSQKLEAMLANAHGLAVGAMDLFATAPEALPSIAKQSLGSGARSPSPPPPNRGGSPPPGITDRNPKVTRLRPRAGGKNAS